MRIVKYMRMQQALRVSWPNYVNEHEQIRLMGNNTTAGTLTKVRSVLKKKKKNRDWDIIDDIVMGALDLVCGELESQLVKPIEDMLKMRAYLQYCINVSVPLPKICLQWNIFCNANCNCILRCWEGWEMTHWSKQHLLTPLSPPLVD